jgi:hypothetical protein
MSAAFTPEHLGAPTTVSFGFKIEQTGEDPVPLTGVELAYPRNLGLGTSDLGLAPCDPTLLEEEGPEICPPNSHMGDGSALVEIPLGGFVHQERVQLALFAGPSPNGRLHLLISAVGTFPVYAIVVLSAELFRGRLSITVPPIPTLPEGPYVALVEMHLRVGGHLTYYEPVHGKNVAYQPTGIGLPGTCPRGGFPFGATFQLLNGTRTTARASVACPKRR